MNTEENPIITDLAEPFGYIVRYWPDDPTASNNEEPLGVTFRVFRAYAAKHEAEIWECEFRIKWDGCLNLETNPRIAMHFCSHEGVRTFAALLCKCFELAGALMPSHVDEFLTDGHYDDAAVMAVLNK